MIKFNSKYFPQYNKLSLIEKVFLRTCCYFPPKPRRERNIESIIKTENYCQTLERAFGNSLWELISDKSVLDLGCGEGGFVLALASKRAGQIIGLDPNIDFLIAKKESQKRGYANAYFLNGTTESLKDNSFDVVISHDSFEHFEYPKKMLSEIVRITKNEGIILIKFGPTWMGPYGRHMSGTIRNDRPWIHLILPEKLISRVHSVYHNEPYLKEKYSQLHGGLNRMTARRFKRYLKLQNNINIIQFDILPYLTKYFTIMPIIGEFFTSGVRVCLIKR